MPPREASGSPPCSSRSAGARVVFATAGSDEKRELPAIARRRATSWTRGRSSSPTRSWRATGGEGVDVVLNSLAGEAIPASLSVARRLRPLPRDRQARHLREPARSACGRSRTTCRSSPSTSTALARERPAPAGRDAARASLRALTRGELTPLPRRVFPLSDAAERVPPHGAGATHRQGRAGRAGPRGRAALAAPARVAFRADGTYLITGGLGGLGPDGRRAGWSREGARHLVLLGRGGASAEAARRPSRRCAQAGARVDVVRARRRRRRGARRRAAPSPSAGLPPLRGVVHAAGVLDDGLAQQDLAPTAAVGDEARRWTAPGTCTC